LGFGIIQHHAIFAAHAIDVACVAWSPAQRSARNLDKSGIEANTKNFLDNIFLFLFKPLVNNTNLLFA
ncbi:hypothetical protein, partial [Kingella kingae]|uniref:hypothetical protein n=1 Tax=Kingella kingae TaxID=504 RepID=UPI001AD806AF